MKIRLEGRGNFTKIVLKISKILSLGIIGIFLLTAFYFSTPVQMMINDEFVFNNPNELSSKYPLKMEGLSSNDVIFVIHTDWAIDYGAIPFQPNPNDLENSFNLLKEIMGRGYEVYVFKNESYPGEKQILLGMVDNNEFRIIDHSNTFCKIIKNDNTKNIKSNVKCLE